MHVVVPRSSKHLICPLLVNFFFFLSHCTTSCSLCLYKTNFTGNLFFFLPASNGVVLAAEKKQKSVLYDDSTINKVRLVVLDNLIAYTVGVTKGKVH